MDPRVGTTSQRSEPYALLNADTLSRVLENSVRIFVPWVSFSAYTAVRACGRHQCVLCVCRMSNICSLHMASPVETQWFQACTSTSSTSTPSWRDLKTLSSSKHLCSLWRLRLLSSLPTSGERQQRSIEPSLLFLCRWMHDEAGCVIV